MLVMGYDSSCLLFYFIFLHPSSTLLFFFSGYTILEISRVTFPVFESDVRSLRGRGVQRFKVHSLLKGQIIPTAHFPGAPPHSIVNVDDLQRALGVIGADEVYTMRLLIRLGRSRYVLGRAL
ncbi:hypothetical protein B9Z19DRAFT_1088564 [Tuber borchii]|uniref:Uncharacterized protein n=1 Tax=Tuber borchii TaxID=42251 RepID=A0A2T6ZLF3_TUBBO|nr:hypothetical protein B9Z19DRAFT_1088564 [Tuber borchii]